MPDGISLVIVLSLSWLVLCTPPLKAELLAQGVSSRCGALGAFLFAWVYIAAMSRNP
jgi:hypothetical protein